MKLPEGVSEEPYSVLGVPRTISMDDLRKVFREKAYACHPDRHAGDAQKEQEFKRLSEAYSLINTPDRRREFAAAMRKANPTWSSMGAEEPVMDTLRKNMGKGGATPKREKKAKAEGKAKPKRRTKRKVSVSYDPSHDDVEPWPPHTSSSDMLASLYTQSSLRRGAHNRELKLEIYLDEDGIKTTREGLDTIRALEKAAKQTVRFLKPLWRLMS